MLLTVILILLRVVLPTNALSFSEDFDQLDNLIWESYPNHGSINIVDSNLELRGTNSRRFPYVRSLVDVSANNAINVEFQYVSSRNFGTGISFTHNTPANGTVLSGVHSTYIDFLVWQDRPGGLRFYTTLCDFGQANCSNSLRMIKQTKLNDFDKHSIKLIRDMNTEHLYFYLDGDTTPIFVSSPNHEEIKYLWFGNPEFTNSNDLWSEINILSVNTSETHVSNPSLLLIPGFGASWNYGALFTNTSSTDWHIPSWLNTYQNLIDSLQNAGYLENQNLFIFPYDWRKPLSSLSVDLHTYIENLKSQNKIPPENEIKIIGHSFGGLVARSYYQQYSPSEVKQIVTVGSPHKGILQAYEGWAGGKITHGDWWTKGILSLILKINNQAGETDRQTLQRLAPSLSNLLPTFDFLEDKNQNLKSISSHTLQNTLLNSLDSSIGTNSAIFTTLTGNQNNTPAVYTYVSPNWYDRLFGNWVDGKPIYTTLTTAGDGTVLNNSAQGIFANTHTSNLDHGDIVFDGQGIYKIFEVLGLDTSKVVATRSGDFIQNVLAVSLRSPGKIQLIDENNNTYGHNSNVTDDYLYLPDEKILMIKDPVGDYKVNIISDGQTGGYNLYTSISQADQTTTESKSGFLTFNDTDFYQVKTDALIPLSPYSSPDYIELLDENSDLLTQTCNPHQTTRKNRCLNLSSYLKSSIHDENNSLLNLFYELHQTFSQSQYDFPQDSDTYAKIKDISHTLETYLVNSTNSSQPRIQDYDSLYADTTQSILALELLFDTTPPTTPSANILKSAIDNTPPTSSQSASLFLDFFKLLIQRNYLEAIN